MANNWYARLLKNIIGRTSNDVSSKGELRLKRLEDRRLLNADFGLAGGILTLDNFEPGIGVDSTSLTISEGSVNIDGMGGNEDVYLFTLDAGTWNEIGGLAAAQFDNTGQVLAVDRALFDGTVDLTIDDANATMADAQDLAVVVGDALPAANLVDFAPMTDITITNVGTITQAGADGLAATSLSVTNAESVTLNDVTNDFDTFTATTRIGVSLTDADDLNVTGITTNIDDATDGVGDDASAVSITTGGNLTVSGAINTTGTAADAQDDNISFTSGGALSITAAVNAGQGDVTLQASGDLTQSGAGIITASDLSVTQAEATAPAVADPADLDMDMSHDIDLSLANAVDTFTASNSLDNGSITFNND
ncbi:MAG: hypothetical protein HON04_12185, partial [Planctomicrobium sp.]|nr:hypothetical protein [Planctomicrobium sp.]